MKEYREHFELYSGPLKITQPEYLCGIFANGLKEEIREEVRVHRPKSLKEMMDLALLIDERNEVYGKKGGGTMSRTLMGKRLFLTLLNRSSLVTNRYFPLFLSFPFPLACELSGHYND